MTLKQRINRLEEAVNGQEPERKIILCDNPDGEYCEGCDHVIEPSAISGLLSCKPKPQTNPM